MDALAAANVLQALSGHRRLARWQAAKLPLKGLLRDAPINDATQPMLLAPTEGQDITADYRSLGLTLGRHPVALLRPALQARRFVAAATLSGAHPDRPPALALGPTHRRTRPQTPNTKT